MVSALFFIIVNLYVLFFCKKDKKIWQNEEKAVFLQR